MPALWTISTHLVDLVQWECFPNRALDYTKDIRVDKAHRWPTLMSASQFNTIYQTQRLPQYLRSGVFNDSILTVFSNGQIDYQVKVSMHG